MVSLPAAGEEIDGVVPSPKIDSRIAAAIVDLVEIITPARTTCQERVALHAGNRI